MTYENRVEHIPDDCTISWPSCTLKEPDEKGKSVQPKANGSARFKPCNAEVSESSVDGTFQVLLWTEQAYLK